MRTDDRISTNYLCQKSPAMHITRMLLFWTFLWMSNLQDVTVRADSSQANLSVSTHDISFQKGEDKKFWVQSLVMLGQDAEVDFYSDNVKVATVQPQVIIPEGNITKIYVNVSSVNVGSCNIIMNTTSQELGDLSDEFIRVGVVHSKVLSIIIIVVGWIYFAAWSISFYPQVILNFQRKSVVGLNFDFLCYNITGFIAYSVFNVGLFWIDPVWEEYRERHPYGVNPVLLNDVVFSLHAVLLTSFTIFQTFIYDRGDQKVSLITKILVPLGWLFILITFIITVASKEKVLNWLDFLYMFSYVKLAVTLIKYVPQAYLNYSRKSTEGWSIGNVLLDFTGGAFSLLQMFLLSYNNDDWASIFGDPTKFGLGVFSIAFDILFIIQHYVLYRNSDPSDRYPEIDEKASLINRKTEDKSDLTNSLGSGEFKRIDESN